jgi:hypothetical protein
MQPSLTMLISFSLSTITVTGECKYRVIGDPPASLKMAGKFFKIYQEKSGFIYQIVKED